MYCKAVLNLCDFLPELCLGITKADTPLTQGP